MFFPAAPSARREKGEKKSMEFWKEKVMPLEEGARAERGDERAGERKGGKSGVAGEKETTPYSVGESGAFRGRSAVKCGRTCWEGS